MRQRLLDLVTALRRAGVRVSVAESLDALEAVARAGVERPVLREALGATLVKDEADRAAFEAEFERAFPMPRPHRQRGERPEPAGEGAGAGRGREGGVGSGRREEPDREGRRPRMDVARRDRAGRPQVERVHERASSEGVHEGPAERSGRRLRRLRELRHRPFRQLDPREVEELDALVDALARRFRARLARRERAARRGRLDLRRTLRRAAAHGGVPLELLRRRRRPGRPDLLALVDLSWSTRAAADFLLALVAPARGWFRRVRVLGYVDRAAEVTLERGHLVPLEPLDLDAPSDLGRVLGQVLARGRDLGRNTLLLVLGDARNNFRPPRADLLKALRARVKAVAWLVPEPPSRWDTGDSVLSAYARHVDLLLPAHDPATLEASLESLSRLHAGGRRIRGGRIGAA